MCQGQLEDVWHLWNLSPSLLPVILLLMFWCLLCFSVASAERRSRPQHSHSFWGIFATLGKTQSHYGTVKLFWIQSWPDCLTTTYIIRLVIIVIMTLTKGHTLISIASLIKLIIRKQWWSWFYWQINIKITLKLWYSVISHNFYNLLCVLTLHDLTEKM